MKNVIYIILFAIPLVCNANVSHLEVSTGIVSQYCDDNFAFYEFRFSNSSQEWINIDSVNLTFDSELANNTINIVVGSQLAFWQEAQELKEREESIKLGVFFAALGAFGKLSNSARGDNAVLAAGTGLTLQGMSKLHDKYRGELVPKNHLLSGRIIVPPNLVIKRWLLLFSDNKKDDSFVKELKLTLFDNNKEIFNKLIDIRTKRGEFHLNCQWQKPITPISYKPQCDNELDERCD